MSMPVTAGALADAHRRTLKLEWVAGKAGRTRQFPPLTPGEDPPPLIVAMNLMRPAAVQVLGQPENDYLNSLEEIFRQDTFERLIACSPVAIIVGDSLDPDPFLVELADSTNTPLLRSPYNYERLNNDLRASLGLLAATKQTLHGVFMEVMGMGVLLTGDCGVGKSELALELVSRGHRLIADDAPEFTRAGPDQLIGRCPDILRDFLEVRGLGILNIRELFGDSVVKPSKYLRLIIDLICLSNDQLRDIDRLQGTRRERIIQGIRVAEITLPVAPGRSLAVIIEAAVRDHMLRLKGIAADEQLATRQRRYLDARIDQADNA